MAASEQIAAFFPQDFADAAVVNGRTIYGYLDRDYFASLAYVSGYAPTFLCDSDDVADVEESDIFTINGTDYIVCGLEPDGTNRTTLCIFTPEGSLEPAQ